VVVGDARLLERCGIVERIETASNIHVQTSISRFGRFVGWYICDFGLGKPSWTLRGGPAALACECASEESYTCIPQDWSSFKGITWICFNSFRSPSLKPPISFNGVESKLLNHPVGLPSRHSKFTSVYHGLATENRLDTVKLMSFR